MFQKHLRNELLQNETQQM